MVLPDGTMEYTVVPIGNSGARQEGNSEVVVTISNLGTLGVVVSMEDPESGVQFWGTPEGVEATINDW